MCYAATAAAARLISQSGLHLELSNSYLFFFTLGGYHLQLRAVRPSPLIRDVTVFHRHAGVFFQGFHNSLSNGTRIAIYVLPYNWRCYFVSTIQQHPLLFARYYLQQAYLLY